MRPRETKKASPFELMFWFFLLCLACVLIVVLAALVYNSIADSLKHYLGYLPTMIWETGCLA